jgi:hypothetical protein
MILSKILLCHYCHNDELFSLAIFFPYLCHSCGIFIFFLTFARDIKKITFFSLVVRLSVEHQLLDF